MGLIYKLTSPSKKVYIGQTNQPFKERWRHHCYSAKYNQQHCVALENAIRKYGKNNIRSEILLYCDDQEMLDYYEIKFIKVFNSSNKKYGYNLTTGGKLGFSMNSDTKEKMSNSHRKKHGNNLPQYLIKTGYKKANVSGYEIKNHPKCRRKRFIGPIEDDAKSLRRALKFLGKLNNTNFKIEKEELPKYVSYMKSRNGYSVQVPIKGGKNLRAQFASKKLTREEKKQQAIDKLQEFLNQIKD